MLSGRNGFSSIAIIEYIASREIIEELMVTTFRIGKQQMGVLANLSQRIKKATLVTSTLQGSENSDAKYDSSDYCQSICKRLGWRYIVFNNHSKVILMKTKANWYVCETSSNLNENPRLEQYNFENNKKVYEFYAKMFDAIKNHWDA